MFETLIPEKVKKGKMSTYRKLCHGNLLQTKSVKNGMLVMCLSMKGYTYEN